MLRKPDPLNEEGSAVTHWLKMVQVTVDGVPGAVVSQEISDAPLSHDGAETGVLPGAQPLAALLHSGWTA